MDALLKGNEIFAKAPYTAPPLLKDTLPKMKKAFIISCMDPRVIPEHFMSFESGEYGVMRNAGGRVAQATREIAFVAAVSDSTDLVVIHHTDCGMSNLNNDIIRKRLAAKGLGDGETATLDFGEIKDLDESVRDDVAALRSSPYVPANVAVHGYVLDLMSSGKLREVTTSPAKL